MTGWPVNELQMTIFFTATHNIAMAKRSFGVSYLLTEDLAKPSKLLNSEHQPLTIETVNSIAYTSKLEKTDELIPSFCNSAHWCQFFISKPIYAVYFKKKNRQCCNFSPLFLLKDHLGAARIPTPWPVMRGRWRSSKASHINSKMVHS